MFSLLLSLLFFSLLFLLTRRLKFLRFNHLKHTLHAAKCVVVLLQLGQDRTHVQQALRGEEKGVYHISTHMYYTPYTTSTRTQTLTNTYTTECTQSAPFPPPRRRFPVFLSSHLGDVLRLLQFPMETQRLLGVLQGCAWFIPFVVVVCEGIVVKGFHLTAAMARHHTRSDADRRNECWVSVMRLSQQLQARYDKYSQPHA